MRISICNHVAANGMISFFYGWVVFHCVSVPHLLNPFICPWTFRLFPCVGYLYRVIPQYPADTQILRSLILYGIYSRPSVSPDWDPVIGWIRGCRTAEGRTTEMTVLTHWILLIALWGKHCYNSYLWISKAQQSEAKSLPQMTQQVHGRTGTQTQASHPESRLLTAPLWCPILSLRHLEVCLSEMGDSLSHLTPGGFLLPWRGKYWKLHSQDFNPIVTSLYLFFYYLLFLQPNLWHVEVPRLEVELELQLWPMSQPRQHGIWAVSVNSTTACSKAGSLTHWARSEVKSSSSQRQHRVLNHWATIGTPFIF